jgi:hypothetical protein
MPFFSTLDISRHHYQDLISQALSCPLQTSRVITRMIEHYL